MQQWQNSLRNNMPNIIPCLWFDSQAEEAANFYVGSFPNSKIGAVARYPEAGTEVHGRPAGSVMTVEFVLDGKPFLGLNGGAAFTFNEAISLIIECKDQDEIDHYWEHLTADGGQEVQCGWLKDKFGVSWQVVPKGMDAMMGIGTDPEKANRAMTAMMKMKKIIMADLQ